VPLRVIFSEIAVIFKVRLSNAMGPLSYRVNPPIVPGKVSFSWMRD